MWQSCGKKSSGFYFLWKQKEGEKSEVWRFGRGYGNWDLKRKEKSWEWLNDISYAKWEIWVVENQKWGIYLLLLRFWVKIFPMGSL